MSKVKYIKIDEAGFFVEDVVLDSWKEVPYGLVRVPVPDGLHKPRWTGSEWIEGLTQEELDAISNTPKPINLMTALGEQLVKLELENMALKQQNNAIGKQLVDLELRLLQLEGGSA